MTTTTAMATVTMVMRHDGSDGNEVMRMASATAVRRWRRWRWGVGTMMIKRGDDDSGGRR